MARKCRCIRGVSTVTTVMLVYACFHVSPSLLAPRWVASSGMVNVLIFLLDELHHRNILVKIISEEIQVFYTLNSHQYQNLTVGQDDCMGHKFRIVGLEYTPFSEYTRETEDPGTQIQLLDSFESRLLVTLSRHLNFT